MNQEYITSLLGTPSKIVSTLIKDSKLDSWNLKSDYLRANISQDILKSAYLILYYELKDTRISKKEYEKCLVDLDIIYHALSDENAAKIQIVVKN